MADVNAGLRLFKLPQELRDSIYGYLLAHEHDLRFGITKDNPSGPGLTTPASENQAADFRCSVLLVCKRLYHEFISGLFGTVLFEYKIGDVLTGPVITSKDTPGERRIVESAKSYTLKAYTGQWTSGDDPNYGVEIIVSQHRDAGYSLKWYHMTDEDKGFSSVGEEQYKAMVERVEAEIETMVAGHIAFEGYSGLTLERIRNVQGAFYLCDLLSGIGWEGEEEMAQDHRNLPWDGEDVSVDPRFNW